MLPIYYDLALDDVQRICDIIIATTVQTNQILKNSNVSVGVNDAKGIIG